MKGERDLGEDEGGGRGIVTISWRESESMMVMDAPAGNARRPEGERSSEPKLLRDGGPGRTLSQYVSGGRK